MTVPDKSVGTTSTSRQPTVQGAVSTDTPTETLTSQQTGLEVIDESSVNPEVNDVNTQPQVSLDPSYSDSNGSTTGARMDQPGQGHPNVRPKNKSAQQGKTANDDSKLGVVNKGYISDAIAETSLTESVPDTRIIRDGDESPEDGGLLTDRPSNQGSSLQSSSPGSTRRRHVVIEQVAPQESTIVDNHAGWRYPLESFTSKREDFEKHKKRSRRVRKYCKTQEELIEMYEDLQLNLDEALDNSEEELRIRKMTSRLAKISFGVNVLLLIAKTVAAAITGSLAVITSVLDSGMDLVSGALVWWSGRAIKRNDIYKYPQGRTRLEPIAIIILSVVMSIASVQMVRESIERIIQYANDSSDRPNFTITAIVICAATVVTKLVLFLVCRKVKSPSIQALAQDHRNDVLSNSVALAAGYIGFKLWSFADPIGALLISIYIIVTWFMTGLEQTKLLTGHTAQPNFLKKLTWITLNHHPQITMIETVRAFHFGTNFLVEIHIVLPNDVPLRESHDIGETLQQKLESLTEVERAFVHVDYDSVHSPTSEHKRV